MWIGVKINICAICTRRRIHVFYYVAYCIIIIKQYGLLFPSLPSLPLLSSSLPFPRLPSPSVSLSLSCSLMLLFFTAFLPLTLATSFLLSLPFFISYFFFLSCCLQVTTYNSWLTIQLGKLLCVKIMLILWTLRYYVGSYAYIMCAIQSVGMANTFLDNVIILMCTDFRGTVRIRDTNAQPRES